MGQIGLGTQVWLVKPGSYYICFLYLGHRIGEVGKKNLFVSFSPPEFSLALIDLVESFLREEGYIHYTVGHIVCDSFDWPISSSSRNIHSSSRCQFIFYFVHDSVVPAR